MRKPHVLRLYDDSLHRPGRSNPGLAAVLAALLVTGLVWIALGGRWIDANRWFIGIVGVAPIIIIARSAWIHGFRLRKRPPTRLPRLQRLADMPEFISRYPHRLVEYALRKQPKGGGACGDPSVLVDLPPGRMFIVLPDWKQDFDLPAPILPSFEPVDIQRDHQRMAALLQGAERTESEAHQLDRQLASARRRWKLTLLGLGVCMPVMLGGLCVSILQLAFAQSSREVRAALFGIIVFGLLGLFVVLQRRRTLVVPGGIARTSELHFIRKPHLSYETCDEASLVVDVRRRAAFACRQGGVCRYENIHGLKRDFLIAAWQSTARTPSLEEVKTFLGAD